MKITQSVYLLELIFYLLLKAVGKLNSVRLQEHEEFFLLPASQTRKWVDYSKAKQHK